MYQPINPIAGRPGFFGAFLTNDGETVAADWRREWDQIITRNRHPVCGECKGFGYRKGERVGCPTCHGLGVIK
jgi:hypothetical protein